MNIKWLDGKNSNGLFVLETVFKDNTKNYIKGNYSQICKFYDILWNQNVIGMTIYDPKWNAIATKSKSSNAA